MGDLLMEFAARLLVAWFESESFSVLSHHAIHSILPFIVR